MTPSAFYATIMMPASTMLADLNLNLNPSRVSLISKPAKALMMAIAGQESAWTDRIQIPGGQARGFWQCELEGAVDGVMLNDGMNAILAKVGALYSIDVDMASTVFEAIAWHDPLAYTVARLALWMDPQPLPAVGDLDGAWATYLRVWRPGKPDPTRWATVYPQAIAVVS